MRVLLTGMSATGKSTLVQELRRRGFVAYDADEEGFSEPHGDGRWGWRRELVAELLASPTDGRSPTRSWRASPSGKPAHEGEQHRTGSEGLRAA